jgi:hypothetical protein
VSVGYPATKTDIDVRAGGAAKAVRDALASAATMHTWLLAKPDGDLTALGYTPTEVAQLKSAFTDLNQLNEIYYGRLNLTTAKDFTTFAKLLVGLG